MTIHSTMQAAFERAASGGAAPDKLDELIVELAEETREFILEREAKLVSRIDALERQIAELKVARESRA